MILLGLLQQNLPILNIRSTRSKIPENTQNSSTLTWDNRNWQDKQKNLRSNITGRQGRSDGRANLAYIWKLTEGKWEWICKTWTLKPFHQSRQESFDEGEARGPQLVSLFFVGLEEDWRRALRKKVEWTRLHSWLFVCIWIAYQFVWLLLIKMVSRVWTRARLGCTVDWVQLRTSTSIDGRHYQSCTTGRLRCNILLLLVCFIYLCLPLFLQTFPF